MNIFEAAANLRITRRFLDKPIDEKVIGLMLYTATNALSAGNIQEWEFIVVNDGEMKSKLSQASLDLKHIKTAPLDIVVCVDIGKAALKYGKRGEIVYAVGDGAAAATLLMLAANALNLGYDYIRSFEEEEVKGILNLPDNVRPVAIIPIGYPAETGEYAKKNPFENITHVNSFNNKIVIEFGPILNKLENLVKKIKTERKSEKSGIKNVELFLKKILG